MASLPFLSHAQPPLPFGSGTGFCAQRSIPSRVSMRSFMCRTWKWMSLPLFKSHRRKAARRARKGARKSGSLVRTASSSPPPSLFRRLNRSGAASLPKTKRTTHHHTDTHDQQGVSSPSKQVTRHKTGRQGPRTVKGLVSQPSTSETLEDANTYDTSRNQHSNTCDTFQWLTDMVAEAGNSNQGGEGESLFSGPLSPILRNDPSSSFHMFPPTPPGGWDLLEDSVFSVGQERQEKQEGKEKEKEEDNQN
uniref:Uncharacterized protein n=1 Tax=Palpitomonas bilix TaxID=652834 RepID=A0A7S3GFQ6_9EUKA|mmetsp:Transcript_47498/g.122998  ORF Transcript_47498/g.122998 Transcript_47498/m.122998 type:complete len:249 (+) Transcript_47498:1009-1755(+)